MTVTRHACVIYMRIWRALRTIPRRASLSFLSRHASPIVRSPTEGCSLLSLLTFVNIRCCPLINFAVERFCRVTYTTAFLSLFSCSPRFEGPTSEKNDSTCVHDGRYARAIRYAAIISEIPGVIATP